MQLYIQLLKLQLIIISIQVINGSFISSILGAVNSLYGPQYLNNDHHHDHHHGIFIIILIIFSLQTFI